MATQKTNRLTQNPITTAVGILIILCSFVLLYFEKLDEVYFAELLIIGIGVAIQRDPSWLRGFFRSGK